MSNAFHEAASRARAGSEVTVEARRLLEQMTLAEKLSCLDGDTPFWDGLIDLLRGGYYEHSFPAAVVPRLGIPGIHFSDGPRGVVIGRCTAFPVSLARGASFDIDLEERIGEAIGKELRASGATFYGGICVNLLRHPAWGRAQETYGEDPQHVGEMGAALCRGVQRHAMACVKHFACNSMENARFQVDVQADERALHEVYLPHFQRVVGAGVASVMSAYNSLNGEWCGQNRTLLTEILRHEWGFSGFVISDFQFGLRDPVLSVQAGLDIEMPFLQQRHQHLPQAVASGTLCIEDVDRAVTRILATLLRFADIFETAQPPEVIACPSHRALAREAAQKSIVLLRNEGGLLPLDAARLRRVAVIGNLAARPNLGDGGSSDVHPPHVVTPLDGLRAALPDVEILAVGSDDLAAARSAAQESDVALVVAGYTREDEGEYVDPAGVAHLFHLFPPMPDPSTGERLQQVLQQRRPESTMSPGGDRTSLTLRESDEALIETVAAANPRTIVAVMGGSAVIMERWRQRVGALLMLWYPGMEGGHALADVLLGRVDASGRLPFAIPTQAEHLPPFDRNASSAVYDLWHGQWKLDRDGHVAAYPFGFGLSYTSFAYSELSVVGTGMERKIGFTVANIGHRRGSDVVQVYGHLKRSSVDRPMQKLLAFTRVELDPGKSRRLTLAISLQPLAVRRNGEWWMEPGCYGIRVARYATDPERLAADTQVE
jgi:beta-glucosidase